MLFTQRKFSHHKSLGKRFEHQLDAAPMVVIAQTHFHPIIGTKAPVTYSSGGGGGFNRGSHHCGGGGHEGGVATAAVEEAR